MNTNIFLADTATFSKIQNGRFLRTLVGIFLAGTLMMILVTTQSYADEISESYDGILVEDAYVQTDFREPIAVLKLKISNFSSSDTTLLGVKTKNFSNARLLMNGSDQEVVEVDSLTILQEETLNLDTSHIWVELSGLRQAIKIGEKIEFDLLFSTGEVSASADIHSSKS